MKKILVVLAACGMLMSCQTHEAPSAPGGPAGEDWSFPASPKFAVTLLSDRSSIAIGESVDVKLVLYNADSVFGAAIELSYRSETLDVERVISGPLFSTAEELLTVSEIEPDSDRVSYGVTYRGGSGRAVSGSGVVMKLRCRGLRRGDCPMTLNPGTLELRRADGRPILHFGNVLLENTTITVR